MASCMSSHHWPRGPAEWPGRRSFTRGIAVTASTVAAASLIVAGCAGGGNGGHKYAAGEPCTPHMVTGEGELCDGTGQIVDVTVKNFRILLPGVIPTGAVTFRVHGKGPTLHEFNVARSTLAPNSLPLAADDTADDTKNTPKFTFIAQVEGIDVGMTKDLTTNITPGHYDFYCNMDGHYMAHMTAQAVAQ